MKIKLSIIFILIPLSVSPLYGDVNIFTAEPSNDSPSRFRNSLPEKPYLYQISPRKLIELWLRFPDQMFDTPSETEGQLHAKIQEARELITLKILESELQMRLDKLNKQAGVTESQIVD